MSESILYIIFVIDNFCESPFEYYFEMGPTDIYYRLFPYSLDWIESKIRTGECTSSRGTCSCRICCNTTEPFDIGHPRYISTWLSCRIPSSCSWPSSPTIYKSRPSASIVDRARRLACIDTENIFHRHYRSYIIGIFRH